MIACLWAQQFASSNSHEFWAADILICPSSFSLSYIQADNKLKVKPESLTPTVRGSGGSVMLWGAVC